MVSFNFRTYGVAGNQLRTYKFMGNFTTPKNLHFDHEIPVTPALYNIPLAGWPVFSSHHWINSANFRPQARSEEASDERWEAKMNRKTSPYGNFQEAIIFGAIWRPVEEVKYPDSQKNQGICLSRDVVSLRQKQKREADGRRPK
ncbi:hypothetical protein GGX14DRAFT_402090 [Mycena pura]|uniref:Uncharacterized protein n=1 Tax=Mycena pura TaxID=153505 RepID=A0AAD6V153_9AGAR|nr:hypothetical protein GGX14DRAFT_402090 [Mycena pura]